MGVGSHLHFDILRRISSLAPRSAQREEVKIHMTTWFRTWNRPEYQERAAKNSKGYRLLIIRRETDKYLCVKANLVMGDRGLPSFEIVQERHFQSGREADKQIKSWKLESTR